MSAFPATAAGGGALETQPAQSMLTGCSVIVGRFLATIVVPLPGTAERCVVERLTAEVDARRVGELGPTPVVVTERWPGGAQGSSGPGDAGYEGEVTLGDEGAGAESLVAPEAAPEETKTAVGARHRSRPWVAVGAGAATAARGVTV